MQAGGAQIVEALCAVVVVERADRFQLDDDLLLDQKVNDVFTDDHSIIDDGNTSLLVDIQSGEPQLVSQRVLINLLQKSTSKCVRDTESTSDHALRTQI